LVSRETRIIFEEAIYRQQAEALPITILFGHAHMAMTAADAVLVASGTATLEAALLKRPMVISYKVPRVSAWITRRKAHVPYLGLPNILSGEFVVPELLQEDANAENLAQALCNQLHDKGVRDRLERKFLEIHRSLRQDTATRAMEAILPMLSVGHAASSTGAPVVRHGMRA
jgi:lipid-A-disaccharide synthase